MTENGGVPERSANGEQERPREAGDSWFKPTGDRNRTQADYRDPYEDKQADPSGPPREEPRDYRSLSSSSAYPNSGGYPGLGYLGGQPGMAEPYPSALSGLGAPESPAAAPHPVPSASNDYPFDLPRREKVGPYSTEPPVAPERDAAAEPPAEHDDFDASGDGSDAGVTGSAFPSGTTYRLDQPGASGYDFDAPLTYAPEPSASGPPAADSGSREGYDWSASSGSYPAEPSVSWDGAADSGAREGSSYDWTTGPESGTAPSGGYPAAGLGEPYAPPSRDLGESAVDPDVSSAEESSRSQDPASVYRIPSGGHTAASLGLDRQAPYRQESGGGSYSGWDSAPYRSAENEPEAPSASWEDGDAAPSPLGYDAPVESETTTEFEPHAADLGGSLGTGSGDTWAFSRNDPRLPDSVREAAERQAAERAAASAPFREAAFRPTEQWSEATSPAADAERTPQRENDLSEYATTRSFQPEDDDSWTPHAEFTEPSSASDPLLAIANEQAQARAREQASAETLDDWRRADELGDLGEAGESTRAMPVSGDAPLGSADQRSAESYDELGGYGGLDYPADPARDVDRGYSDEPGYCSTSDRVGGAEPGYDELGYVASPPRAQEPESGYADELGYDERPDRIRDIGPGYDELGYTDRPGVDADRPYDELGYTGGPERQVGRGFSDELGYTDRSPLDDSYSYEGSDHGDHSDRFGEPEPDRSDSGYPSTSYGDPADDYRFEPGEGTQAMPVLDEEAEPPARGRHGAELDTYGGGYDGRGGPDEDDLAEDDQARARWEGTEHDARSDGQDHYDDDVDDRYYPEPLPENRSRAKKRDRISDEFPGFSGPLGGDPDSDYPGYDNIDVWPETEGLATATVWLGGLSLIPGIGLVLAAAALFLGPKATRNIRASRGDLEGEQLVKTGTVLAYVGIAVSVVALVGYFLFG